VDSGFVPGGHFRQSKRRTALFLQSLLNVPCSTSKTIKIQEEVNQGLAAPYEEAHRQLESQTQLFVDETPTKEQSRKVWLWVAVAPTFAVFGIFLDRSRESLRRLFADHSELRSSEDVPGRQAEISGSEESVALPRGRRQAWRLSRAQERRSTGKHGHMAGTDAIDGHSTRLRVAMRRLWVIESFMERLRWVIMLLPLSYLNHWLLGQISPSGQPTTQCI